MQVDAALGYAIGAVVANGLNVGPTLDRFARLQTLRAAGQVASLAAVVWLLLATLVAG